MLKKLVILTMVFALTWGLWPDFTFGSMSSTNYAIFADTFNTGGVSTTGTLRLEGTLGESPVGTTTASGYVLQAGYQSMDKNQLTLVISNSSLSLGTLTTGQVSSANTTATITTDSNSGYTLQISSISGSGPAAVGDGSVTAGQEEYGLAVSGSAALFADDRSVSVSNIASTSTIATNSATVLTFKASRASNSTAATYSQTITLSVSNNL